MKTKIILITLIAMLAVTAFLFQSCTKDDEINNELPTCKITAPINNQELVKGDTIIISVETSDNDGTVTEVSFSIDGIGKASFNSYPYDYNWLTNNESIGSHILKATSTDNNGGSTSHDITITIIENDGGDNPCPGTPTVTDADGNVYNTVQIGSQCWMKENLRVGTRIDRSQAMTNNSVIEKYCYADNPNNCETYGGLYQWDEIMQYTTTEGVQGICPNGWHLPTDEEWKQMEMALGMNQDQADTTDWRGTDEGEKMKSTSSWYDNGNGTNSSGFTALASGYTSNSGTLSIKAYWWSSTERCDDYAWYRTLHFDNDKVGRSDFVYLIGISVRCLKN